MASNLTNKGQEIAVAGATAPTGGVANLAVALRLYDGTSLPTKSGVGFNQLVAGNGYPAGGWPISRADWTLTLSGGDRRITLAQRNLVAAGPISLLAGAYIVNAAGEVLAWWETASLYNMFAGDTIRIDLFLQALPSA